MIMPYQVQYGKNTIQFSLIRKERKAIKICVLPELTVEVLAPSKVSMDKIKEKVQKKGAWILKNLTYFRQFLPKESPREYVGGETHRYLGRQYRLKIIKSKEGSVKLKGGYIIIKTKSKGETQAIIIENKIYADDQGKQMIRYDNHGNKLDKHYLFYLILSFLLHIYGHLYLFQFHKFRLLLNF